jgi:gamma-glutamyltranspeptidase/glutathione hydrolase
MMPRSTLSSRIGRFAGLSLICAVICLHLSPTAEAGPAQAKREMVAAANPWAVDAGVDILRAGGSAVDAAIAVQLVLNLVEPQSSGIGGGAFMVHYNGATRQVIAYDGREMAPQSVTPDLFLRDGKPMKFFDAVVGGQSVGVPGVVAMLELAHNRHGRLPWAQLFAAAIRLADHGFPVSPRLNALLTRDKYLKTFETARRYFYDEEAEPRSVGWVLQNQPLAETLRVIAAGGSDAFYKGDIAGDIIRTVQGTAQNPGMLSRDDFAAYRAVAREPVCAPYRQYTVCGMPPPTSGGLTILQILGMLEQFDLGDLTPGSPKAVHLISEASRLAFADRARYMADSDFVRVPIAGLLNRDYLGQRAALIDMNASLGSANAGDPPRQLTQLWGDDGSLELPSTTHISVVDARGNAVSMTSSVENAFGSRLMAGGFLLNNQLTDFSFVPSRDGRPVANRVEPRKRPRSSMSPTIVLNADGSLKLVIGSPGGSRIIPYVAKTIIAVLDWGLDVQAAIDLPHHANRNGKTDLEANTAVAAIAPALEGLGHKVTVRGLNSGLHGIERIASGLRGGADPRREGVARGD